MEFLLNYGLDNNDIDRITEFNNKSVIKNLILNKKNIGKIIDYLLHLGITVNAIVNLLTYQIGLFFRTKKEISDVFDEYEIDSIVKSLNYDVNTVDMIEFL